MSVLRNILNGIVQSNFILIEDAVQHDGLEFVIGLVRHFKERSEELHWFCTDSTAYRLFHHLEEISDVTTPVQCCNHVAVHKVFENPSNWNSPSNDLSFCTDLNVYLNCHDKNTEISDRKRTIVIDSISPFLLEHGIGKTSRMLLKLKESDSSTGKKSNQIVCLVHGDVHDETVIRTLEYLTTTILRLDSKETNKIHVVHKYESGKVSREEMQYSVSDGNLEITETSKAARNIPVQSSKQEVHQLASKLTFNVSLKEDEKEQRAKLVLPHERIRKIALNPPSSGGKIFYEPDAADDIDDEDPDDDLDL